MYGFQPLVLAVFICTCSLATPIDGDSNNLDLDQIDQSVDQSAPLKPNPQDPIVNLGSTQKEIATTISDVQQPDVAVAITDSDSRQPGGTVSDGNPLVTLGEDTSPTELIWDAVQGIWKSIGRGSTTVVPVVPQAAPQRQSIPGRFLCPSGIALCCHDRARKSIPRPSKAPDNRDPKSRRIADSSSDHTGTSPAPDRDDEQRYDFNACVDCTISPSFEYRVSLAFGRCNDIVTNIALDKDEPTHEWCLNKIQCCEAYVVSALLDFMQAA